ncbi:MAG: PDZ domain-containing protein, partial [Clostridia bacterium]|nr:PDZ domain-containing protein [Clostridia bacterium]
SAYMNEETYSAYTEAAVGNMVGIGIHVIYDTVNGYIEIVNIIENSPASESDLQIGDLIYEVEGQSVPEVGYEYAVDLMLGEEGTNANFSVYRSTADGKENQSIHFSVTRKKIITQDVFSHIYEGDSSIGIIRIDSFNGKAAEQFFATIEAFTSQGVDKLIVDVRNNPGGDLNVICNVLDFLLPYGPIIRVMNRDGSEEAAIYSDEEYFEIPIAVLTNGNTASAAELFSAALKDYADKGLLHNVTLVGTTTFGKGSMQSILNLKDGTGLKLSTGMYAPPFSDNYDGVGITPDVVVELDESLRGVSIYKIKDEDDNQLMAAVKALTE